MMSLVYRGSVFCLLFLTGCVEFEDGGMENQIHETSRAFPDRPWNRPENGISRESAPYRRSQEPYALPTEQNRFPDTSYVGRLPRNVRNEILIGHADDPDGIHWEDAAWDGVYSYSIELRSGPRRVRIGMTTESVPTQWTEPHPVTLSSPKWFRNRAKRMFAKGETNQLHLKELATKILFGTSLASSSFSL